MELIGTVKQYKSDKIWDRLNFCMNNNSKRQCYKLVQGFRVTCLFTGQCNTKNYDMVTDIIQLLVGSAFLLVGSRNYSSHNLQYGFLVLAATKGYCFCSILSFIILRPDKYNIRFKALSSSSAPWRKGFQGIVVLLAFPQFLSVLASYCSTYEDIDKPQNFEFDPLSLLDQIR